MRLHALAAAAADTNSQIRSLRMRPFSDACEALPRAVRDLSTSSGKTVKLVIEGAEVEADRAILGQLREAILHLVRNAVDHGIEPGEERLRVGKPKQATVTVSARMTGSGLTVAVRDDGAGLDVEAIRKRLRAKGQAVPAADRDVARALLGGGLSTRTQATAISGRGVGLDLVRDAVERIQGRIEIDWQVGAGTSVVIECPPSLAGVRAVIVEAGSQIMAFPSAQVQRLVRVEVAEIRSLDGRQVMTRQDAAPIPLVALATLLPPLVAGPVGKEVQAVILESSGRLLAVVVDQLLEEQELLLMPVTQDGARLPLVSGASLLPDGGVALVLETTAVVEAGLTAPATFLEVATPQVAGPQTHRILLVDDSLTTRILEQGILETAGYEVTAAPDGSAAWRILNEGGADLIVSDVEMPIMDGIALCQAVRASRQFAELPVVLVSALESEEDRKRGRLAGADAYLGKSGFDQARLLETIRQLLGG